MAGYIGSKVVSLSTDASDISGNITVGGTVDGRDVSVDGTKLDGVEASATADQTKADIEGLGIDLPAANLTGTVAAARLDTATTQAESDDSTKIATTAYVVDKITTLIGGAPSTLNDLNELAAAINDDANYNSTLTTALATKLPLAGGTMTGALTATQLTSSNGILELDDNGSHNGIINSPASLFINIDSDNSATSEDFVIAKDRNSTSGGTELFRVQEDGNVGIGTSSPQRSLSIGTHGSSSTAEIAFGTTTTGNASLLFGDGTTGTALYDGYIQYQHNGGNMLFATGGGSERMRIDSSGNVGIGVASSFLGESKVQIAVATTDPNAGSPTASSALVVKGGTTTVGNGPVFSLSNISGSKETIVRICAETASGNNGDLSFSVYDGGGTIPEVVRFTSAGNVGIGTSSPDPSTKLTVAGAITVTGANTGHGASRLKLGQDNSAISQLRFYGADNSTAGILQFTGSSADGAVGAERMRIDASGNVGIGNTSPTDKLHLGTSSGGTQLKIQSGSGINNCILHTNGTTDSWRTGMNLTVANGSYEFYDDVNNVSRLIIDTSGNVGIGITPACALHIDAPDNGAIVAIFDTDNSGSKLIFRNNSTTGNNTQIGAEGNDLVAFTGGVAHMRIASNGAATIGPATYGGSGYSVGLQLRYAGGGAQYGIDFLPDADGANACDFFNAAGSLVGYIALGATSTAYVTSSDYRLKTDAQPMVGASARVQALNPVNFEWLSDGTRVDGFLAHEAQAIVPEAVTGTKDAMMDQEYEVTPAVIDENGTTTTEAVMGTRSVPDYQGIDQSKIVPLLTAALQEALTKIDDMETRLAALEA